MKALLIAAAIFLLQNTAGAQPLPEDLVLTTSYGRNFSRIYRNGDRYEYFMGGESRGFVELYNNERGFYFGSDDDPTSGVYRLYLNQDPQTGLVTARHPSDLQDNVRIAIAHASLLGFNPLRLLPTQTLESPEVPLDESQRPQFWRIPSMSDTRFVLQATDLDRTYQVYFNQADGYFVWSNRTFYGKARFEPHDDGFIFAFGNNRIFTRMEQEGHVEGFVNARPAKLKIDTKGFAESHLQELPHRTIPDALAANFPALRRQRIANAYGQLGERFIVASVFYDLTAGRFGMYRLNNHGLRVFQSVVKNQAGNQLEFRNSQESLMLEQLETGGPITGYFSDSMGRVSMQQIEVLLEPGFETVPEHSRAFFLNDLLPVTQEQDVILDVADATDLYARVVFDHESQKYFLKIKDGAPEETHLRFGSFNRQSGAVLLTLGPNDPDKAASFSLTRKNYESPFTLYLPGQDLELQADVDTVLRTINWTECAGSLAGVVAK